MANGANYIGQQIGNYRIERELADGGFGTVYLAKHTLLKNRVVAIKLLHATHLASQKERDSFIQEAETLEMLKHPHILPLLDVGFYNNVPYLVSEYAPQGSLQDRLDRRGPKPMSVQKMLAILSQVGQALQFAHDQNVIHRDIKPDNILFNAKGEALLADFGIATTLTTKISVKQTAVVGTFAYMAPERFQGVVSKEGDQYALGCVAYELATGQLPFDPADPLALIGMHAQQSPTNPAQINPQLPAYIAQAIIKALAKQRADRHASVTAFITALQTAGNPSSAQPQKPSPNAAAPTSILAQCLPPTVPATPAPVPALPPTVPATPAPTQGLPPTVQVNPNPFTWTQKTKDEWIREGHTHYNATHYEDALFAYEQAIILEPNDATSYLYRGNALFGLSRYQEAYAAYHQAIGLNYKLAWAHLGAGNALKALKKHDEALASYDAALRLNSNLVQAYIGKGDIYYHRGTDYNWLRQRAEDPYGNYEAAQQKLKNQQLLAAQQAYEQAIKLDPNIAEVHNSKGVVLLTSGRYTEALAVFQHAIQLNPYLAIAYQNLGTALSRLRFTKQAQEAFDKAKQLGYKGQ